MPKRKGLRVLLWVIGIFVLLLVIASVAVKIFFTKEKLLAMIQPRIEAAIQRKVEIQDVSVSIFGGLGADVEGVKIYNPPGFSRDEFVEFKTLSIRVKFWPLFRKRIEMKKLILDQPVIALEKDINGVSNVDDLIKGEGGIALFPLAFEQMKIKNGKLILLDQAKPAQILLSQINQEARFSLDKTMENGKSSGKLSIAEIEVSLSHLKKEIPELSFSLEHEVTYNLPKDSLNIDELTIALGKASFDLKGRIKNLTTSPAGDLSLSSDKIKIEDVLDWVPKPEDSPLNEIEGAGNSKITADFAGEFKLDPLPLFTGQIVLSDVKIKSAQLDYPFEMSYGQVDFDQKALSFFTSQGKIKDAKIEISAVVDNYQDPDLAAELKSDFDLKLLKELKKIPEQIEAKGKVRVDLKAFGKAKKTEDLKFSGGIWLKDAKIGVPFLGVPVEDLDADLALKEDELRLNAISLKMGRSSASLQGSVRQALPYFLKQKEEIPLIEFSLNSPLLNLDEILPSKKPESKEEKGKQDTLMLPAIEAAGQINVQKLVFRDVELSDVMANVKVSQGIINVDNVVSKVYSGSLGGKALCDLNDPEHVRFDMQVNASKIEANDFLSRFTLFKDHLYGKLDISANFTGRGNEADDVKSSLFATGKMSVEQGKLVNWDLLNLLGEYLQVKEAKDYQIRNLKNTFLIQNQRVHFDEFFTSTKDADWQVSGSVGFDGSLDYAVGATLSSEFSKRFDALGEISEYLKNDAGRVVIDLKLKGTTKKPEFTLDTSRAEKKFQSQLKIKEKELKDELKEKGEELLKKFLKKR